MNDCYNHLLNKIRIAEKQSMQPHLQYIFAKTICDAVGFYKQYWNLNFFELIAELSHAQTDAVDKLIVSALKLKYLGHPDAALMVLERATDSGCHTQFSRYLTAELLRELKRFEEARKLCSELQHDFPDFDDVESCFSMCDIDELLNCRYDYYQILNHAHKLIKPTNYIEIGVASGKSLALARTGTNSIGIDPLSTGIDGLFFLSPEVEPILFPMTSDDFFNTLNVSELLGEAAFDMAFIDGDHTFEQALADFIHLECLARSSSVIFIHDCLPVNPNVAEKQRSTKFWCGDVWRLLPCLKELRPELSITTFPVAPTGLAMITGLNPGSRILHEQFEAAVDRYSTLPLPVCYAERCSLLNVSAEDPLKVLEEHLFDLNNTPFDAALRN